jgi:hypothetical protein
MRFRPVFLVLGGALAIGTAACSSDLAVTNPNNPDIGRALALPADVENLLSGGFNLVVGGTTGGNTENVNTSFQVMSLENYTALANFNMGPRAALPRTPILNFANNPGSASVSNDFNGLSRMTRSMSLGLERLRVPGFSLGSATADLRAQAYGLFVLGLAHGYLASTYDSSTVVLPGSAANQPLVPYDSVGRAAIRMLDSAFALTNNATLNVAAGALPANWLNLSTGTAVTIPEFGRIIRSFRARMRPQIARSPTERAAVNWALVLADAQNGITADMSLNLNPTAGWTQSWIIQHYVGTNWHVQPLFMIGMADSVGTQYSAWLNQPLLTRTPFLIQTADRRFPAGSTRAAQNAASGGGTSGAVLPTGVYYRNRVAANDAAAADGTWGFSFYDHARFQPFQNASRIGVFPHMTTAEMNALIAEAAIRTGDFALAATAIDRTRVSRGGLPPLVGAGITSLTQPVPGGNACVPRIPVRSSAGVYTTTCGNILEAMKWEKRMETSYINYGAWYFDSRGWGDLPEGTPIHFPVPWQEQLNVRRGVAANVGGVGAPNGTPRGTYGFP